MSDFIFDSRWIAQHGIGRFAMEVSSRLNNWTNIELSGSPSSPLDPLRLARHLRSRDARAYFSPGYNVPAWAACPVITTIHDLIHAHFYRARAYAQNTYFRFLQRPIVRRSPLTLTVSEFSRQQIIQWYDVDESRVVSVGNGVSSEFTDQGDRVQNDRPYFMYVGNTRGHKNIDVLLKAFAQVRRSEDAVLMMITAPTDRLSKAIDQLGLSNQVEVTGGISDAHLAKIYRGAVSLLMPSLYEGFGLPVVEAMACGCPVIASNRTALPEVIGGAGCLFDPEDGDEMASHMLNMLNSSDLQANYKQLGLVRSKAFSWDATAQRVNAALTAVVG